MGEKKNFGHGRYHLMRTFLFPALFLCFLVSCGNAGRPDSSQNANSESDFEFQIEKRGAVITAYTGESPEVVIPRRIQGRLVREIGSGAFAPRNRERITSVLIPNTVTRIGSGAFKHNGLTSVVIPPGLTVIEREAFSNNRLTSVTLPKGVTRIGNEAFSNNELVSLDLPRGLTIIGWGAFSSNKLERLVLPPGLKSLGEGAFRFNQLSDLELPAGIESIGHEAFRDNRLREIKLPAGLLVIGNLAFFHNNISSVVLPTSIVTVGTLAFEENPLTNVTIEPREPPFTGTGVFHPRIPGFLPAGTYVKGDDENWFRQEGDGSLIDFPSYYRRLIAENPCMLAFLVYDAIEHNNAVALRQVIFPGSGLGALVYPEAVATAGMSMAQYMGWKLFPNEYNKEPVADTPLVHLMRREKPLFGNEYNEEIVALLLEEGAVPEYWMLARSYLQLGLAKMLLEHGALENRTGPDPGSILSLYDYKPERTAFLLEYLPRPLALEEYRLLTGLNKERYRYTEEGVDREREDKWGYDALILGDVKKGILDPLKKDDRGQDLFDWAAETGTAGLMEALMPALKKSGRVILSPDGAGLYAKALKAKNYKTAALLYAEAPHKFIAKDNGGNEYSLEYYFYEYDAIYRRAQEIDNRSLYESGPGGTKPVQGSQAELRYEPNTMYITYSYDEGSTLRRVDGSSLDINALVNAERNRYYAATGKEKPNGGDPGWHVSRIFGDVLFLYDREYWYGDDAEQEFALLNLGKGSPSAYILEAGPLKISAQTALYEPYTWISLMDGAMDFVISGDRAFLVKGGGEVMVFTARNRSLVWEKTIPYRECRIPAWKGGRRVFAAGDSVEAWDFAAGTGTVLGKRLEIPHYHVEGRNYLYEDAGGRRFIAEAETGRVFPEPEDPWHNFALFDLGYIYTDEKEEVTTVCIFAEGKLKRKLKFSGNAVDHSFSIYGNKIYVGAYGLAFTLNLDTAKVDRAFYAPETGGNTEIYVYMFPFGSSDMVYTYIIDYGK